MKTFFNPRKKLPRGAAATDLIFFILFLVVLGVVWSLTGGPDRSISREGPFLNPPFPLGDGIAYNVPGVTLREPSRPGSSSGVDGQSNNGEERTVTSLISRIRAGFGFINEDTSPYAGDVSLNVRSARDTDANDQYVVIKINTGAKKPLRVSDWRLESSVTQLGADINGAAYLPFSGQVNPELPLDAQPGAVINIITGKSPIGASFRTNFCTGYFEQFQNFVPKLDEQCLEPIEELEEKINDGFVPNEACINYVERLDPCELTLDSLPSALGQQCQNFILNDLTYSGCVAEHKNDIGFYNNEWYVYLNRDQALWKQKNERIRLIDENGLIIDAVSY